MLRAIAKATLSLGLCAVSAQAKHWYETYDFSQVSSQVVSLNEDTILRCKSVLLGQGKDQFSAYYDSGSMNLRYVVKGRIHFSGTPWDGFHGGTSGIKGKILINSAPSLAWAYKGSWKDPRKFDYAPLPANYVKFNGTYRSGDKTVFNYTVGDKQSMVMEMPEMKNDVFIRHFNISETKEELLLKVIDSADQSIQVNTGSLKLEQDGNIRFVRIPAGSKNLSFAISYKKASAAPKVASSELSKFTKGGPLRWAQKLELKGKVNDSENEYFAVDQIPIPSNNPWNSKIRFGGGDYFSDGDRAAFCTWNGDVWIASNLNDSLNKVVWKRYAAGLNEALGLKIVDNIIYVTGKDQITRLHDLNNDGEADYYENFNNDIKITKNFHEFTFGLKTDAAGNFYIAKGSPVLKGGRGFDITHDHHGVVYKISKDGKRSEVFANGLRAPGGLSINPEGTIATTGENEGTYVPACKINYLEKGDFAGVIHPGNGRKESEGYKSLSAGYP